MPCTPATPPAGTAAVLATARHRASQTKAVRQSLHTRMGLLRLIFRLSKQVCPNWHYSTCPKINGFESRLDELIGNPAARNNMPVSLWLAWQLRKLIAEIDREQDLHKAWHLCIEALVIRRMLYALRKRPLIPNVTHAAATVQRKQRRREQQPDYDLHHWGEEIR